MLDILKVLLTLGANHRLKLSMPQIESLATQLIGLLIIGMFLTTLAAVAVAAGLFGLYQGLMSTGLSGTSAILIVSLVLMAIVGLGTAMLIHCVRSIRAGLKSVAHFEVPVVGPVVNQVNHVAQSFVSGLLHSQKSAASRKASG